MIKINSAKVLENSDKNLVAAMVTALPKGSLLIALGLAEMPKVGEKVVRTNSASGYATIKSVDLINGTATVGYTPLKWWKADDSDWNWSESAEYTVPKPAKSSTTDNVSFENLEYWTGVDVYELQA